MKYLHHLLLFSFQVLFIRQAAGGVLCSSSPLVHVPPPAIAVAIDNSWWNKNSQTLLATEVWQTYNTTTSSRSLKLLLKSLNETCLVSWKLTNQQSSLSGWFTPNIIQDPSKLEFGPCKYDYSCVLGEHLVSTTNLQGLYYEASGNVSLAIQYRQLCPGGLISNGLEIYLKSPMFQPYEIPSHYPSIFSVVSPGNSCSIQLKLIKGPYADLLPSNILTEIGETYSFPPGQSVEFFLRPSNVTTSLSMGYECATIARSLQGKMNVIQYLTEDSTEWVVVNQSVPKIVGYLTFSWKLPDLSKRYVVQLLSERYQYVRRSDAYLVEVFTYYEKESKADIFFRYHVILDDPIQLYQATSEKQELQFGLENPYSRINIETANKFCLIKFSFSANFYDVKYLPFGFSQANVESNINSGNTGVLSYSYSNRLGLRFFDNNSGKLYTNSNYQLNISYQATCPDEEIIEVNSSNTEWTGMTLNLGEMVFFRSTSTCPVEFFVGVHTYSSRSFHQQGLTVIFCQNSFHSYTIGQRFFQDYSNCNLSTPFQIQTYQPEIFFSYRDSCSGCK